MFFCRSRVRAVVTDDALLVRVTGASPRLWRAPLAQLTAATLEIVTGTEKGKTVHRLMANTAGGSEEIARFDDAKTAERAFISVSDRLLDGQRGLRAARRGLFARLLIALGKVIVWLLFLFMIAVIASTLFLKSRGIDPSMPAPRAGQTNMGQTNMEQPGAPQAAPAAGVSVPADQLFGQ